MYTETRQSASRAVPDNTDAYCALGVAAPLAVRFLFVTLEEKEKKLNGHPDYRDYNPIRTFTFFVLHVRHPVLLRVNLPRLRCTGSASNDDALVATDCVSTFTARWRL